MLISTTMRWEGQNYLKQLQVNKSVKKQTAGRKKVVSGMLALTTAFLHAPPHSIYVADNATGAQRTSIRPTHSLTFVEASVWIRSKGYHFKVEDMALNTHTHACTSHNVNTYICTALSSRRQQPLGSMSRGKIATGPSFFFFLKRCATGDIFLSLTWISSNSLHLSDRPRGTSRILMVWSPTWLSPR